jgi:hypothetical protein
MSPEEIKKLSLNLHLYVTNQKVLAQQATVIYQSGIFYENGKPFIYACDTRQGFFGKEWYVTKCSVDPGSSNGMETALKTTPGDGRRYVMDTSKALSDGQQVKLK